MADVEVSRGFPLFYRNADANSYGVLNVREAFAEENPELVRRVLEVYERGRQWALANSGELAKILATAAKLPDPVAAKQLERTQFVEPVPGEAERQTIIAAGKALQTGGVIKPEIDVVATVDSLSNGRFIFGVGAGWNRPEIENHGVEFDKRWRVVRERILAMKTIWSEDEPEFHGEFVDFNKLWSYPKPVQKGGPPIWLEIGRAHV